MGRLPGWAFLSLFSCYGGFCEREFVEEIISGFLLVLYMIPRIVDVFWIPGAHLHSNSCGAAAGRIPDAAIEIKVKPAILAIWVVPSFPNVSRIFQAWWHQRSKDTEYRVLLFVVTCGWLGNATIQPVSSAPQATNIRSRAS